MIDLKNLRKNPDFFKKKLARKFFPEKKIDEFLQCDAEKLNFLQQIEKIKTEQNLFSKKIAEIPVAEKKDFLEKMKKISAEKKILEKKFAETEKIWEKKLAEIPNLPHDSAPDGASDAENLEIRKWGKIPQFDFAPREHFEIAENLDLLDQKRAAKISGARFCFLKNQLAILQRALVFWAFSEIAKKNFVPMIPPFLTKKKAIFGTGYFDKNENYCVNPGSDDLFLIGTSEVPMASFFADEILDENFLPQKFVSYSPCFRREAGSYGRDTRGIFRVHQFEKVEMIIFCAPENSEKMHAEILKIEEEILQKLELPHRVVDVCCGDLGASAAKKFDIEAWLPAQKKFREMTSTSICTDFQSRRLKIRMRRKNGEIIFPHILNGTAVSSRPLIAILENFQKKNGSVEIPRVLQKFCGFPKIKKNF